MINGAELMIYYGTTQRVAGFLNQLEKTSSSHVVWGRAVAGGGSNF